MNKNKKNAKNYKQVQINKIKDSAYSGLYSEIAYVASILVIIIDALFSDHAIISKISKFFLIIITFICIIFSRLKIQKIKDIEKGNKFFSAFLPQWTIEVGYWSPVVSCLAILVSLASPLSNLDKNIIICMIITWNAYRKTIHN